MSITAYVGLPGHGKSYGVVENVILPALRQKRTVFTNIPMNDDLCLDDFGMFVRYFDIDNIKENDNWWTEVFESGSIFVIDELWRLWPSGLKANNVRESDKSFLAEHRHMVGENGLSTEIVFVTQNLNQIASFARSLVEVTYNVSKLSSAGMGKRFRVDVYDGCVTGPSPPVSKRQRELYGKFKKEVYKYYKSHTKSESGEAGLEEKIDDRFNVLKGTSIKFGLVSIVVAVLVFYFGLASLVDYYSLDDNEVVESVEVESIESIRENPVKELGSESKQQDKSIKIETKKNNRMKLLSLADDFYIAFNFGTFPDVQYTFGLVVGGNEAVLKASELEALEYRIIPVNSCFVKIIGHDFNGFAMCKSSDKKEGWVESLVTTSSNS